MLRVLSAGHAGGVPLLLVAHPQTSLKSAPFFSGGVRVALGTVRHPRVHGDMHTGDWGHHGCVYAVFFSVFGFLSLRLTRILLIFKTKLVGKLDLSSKFLLAVRIPFSHLLIQQVTFASNRFQLAILPEIFHAVSIVLPSSMFVRYKFKTHFSSSAQNINVFLQICSTKFQMIPKLEACSSPLPNSTARATACVLQPREIFTQILFFPISDDLSAWVNGGGASDNLKARSLWHTLPCLIY